MSLPKIAVQKYTMKLPSNGKSIDYRPFQVREEKILMTAAETGTEKDMQNAMIDVINSCLFGQVDARTLPSFDVEYIFLKLRARSVGEIVNLNWACDNEIVDVHGNPKPCGAANEFEVNLEELKIEVPKDKKNNIEVGQDANGNVIGVVMKYPTIESLSKIQPADGDSFDTIRSIVVGCIDTIYVGEEIYPAAEATVDELNEFIESIPTTKFPAIVEFFNGIPRVKTDLHLECSSCGHKKDIHLEGIQSFF